MAKFASFDFSGLSPKAREAVNKSSFTRGKKGADGIPMIVVSIAGATLGPFHGLQEAADETKKWAKKKFPGKVAADSIDAIAAKYGHEVQQNDATGIDPYDYSHTIFQICTLNGKIKELSKMESYKREMDSLIKKVESGVAKMTPEQKKTLRMIKDNYKNSDFKIKGL